MVVTPRLKQIREKRLLTQEELGRKAQVAEITVLRLEAGKSARFSSIRKLAEALGVPPEMLVEAEPKQVGIGIGEKDGSV